MNTKNFYQKLKKLESYLLSNCFFLLEKIKKNIKSLYKTFSIKSGRTINITNLINSGEAVSKKVFKGEVYSLKQKLDIKNKKFKYLPEGIYDIPDYHIYTIKNGIIKTGTNSIFSQSGRKITGVNFQDLPDDFRIIKNFKKIRLDKVDGNLLVLGVGLIENNYSHAWTELAARAYASYVSKIKYDFILIDFENEFTRQIIKILNLSDKKILISSKYTYLTANNLIYPELINNFKEYFINGISIYHRKYLPSWIKSLYREALNNLKILNTENTFRKIYISRRDQNFRKIINEKNLIHALERKGYKTLFFEDYSVVDQIKIMQESNEVVAIHGAGLININFCRKGTKILELFPSNYQCAFFYMHSIMMDLEYSFYIGQAVNKLWRISPIMEDFYVDVNYIENFISNNWEK